MNTHKTSLLLIAAALGASALCSSLFAATHDQDPKAVSTPAPKYPYEQKRAEIEGAVLVSFTITAQGDVTDVTAVKSTDRGFEESALKAVSAWKFAPALKAGRPVDLPALQIVTFTLNGQETPTSLSTLVATMRPQHAVPVVMSHDKCFCGSGKMFTACHGTDRFLLMATK